MGVLKFLGLKGCTISYRIFGMGVPNFLGCQISRDRWTEIYHTEAGSSAYISLTTVCLRHCIYLWEVITCSTYTIPQWSYMFWPLCGVHDMLYVYLCSCLHIHCVEVVDIP